MALGGGARLLAATGDLSRRVELAGVSVVPPPGPEWRPGPRGRTYASWGRRAPADSTRTLVLTALVERIQIGGAVLGPVRTVEELERVERRRLRSQGRYVTIESRIRPDRSLGAECVRVDAVQEQRDNPRFPGMTMALSLHSIDCLHPLGPGYVVALGYSEGYAREPQERAVETLQALGEAFIQSATFTAVR